MMRHFTTSVFDINRAYAAPNYLLVFFLYLAILLIYIILDRNNKIGLGLFVSLLIYHTFMSLFQSYTGGIPDAIGYYNTAANADRFTYNIFGGYDLVFMQTLLFPLIHYFKLTFLSCNLIFNLFGFAGLILFYYSLLDYLNLENGKGTYLPYLLFLPSFSFWTAFAGKDAILFFCLGLFLYSLANIKKRFILAIIALLLMLHVRPYMCIIVCLSFIMANSFNKESNLIFKVILIFAAIGLLLLGRTFYMEKQNIDITNIDQSQKAIESSQGAWGGGSDTHISNYNVPGKILTFLYRPLFIDAHSLMMVISSFENLLLLIISLCFIKVKFYKTILGDKSLYGKFNFYYFIIATTLLAYTNANLGTIVRKRIMVSISLVALVVIYYYKQKTLALNIRPQINQQVRNNFPNP